MPVAHADMDRQRHTARRQRLLGSAAACFIVNSVSGETPPNRS